MKLHHAIFARRVGKRIAAHRAFIQNIGILPRIKLKRRRFGQRQPQQRHFAAYINHAHARRHGARHDGFCALVSRQINHHIALRATSAQQHHAVGNIFIGKRKFIIIAQHHIARHHLGNARSAHAALASVGQVVTLAQRGFQNGFIGIGFKLGLAGRDGDLGHID